MLITRPARPSITLIPLQVQAFTLGELRQAATENCHLRLQVRGASMFMVEVPAGVDVTQITGFRPASCLSDASVLMVWEQRRFAIGYVECFLFVHPRPAITQGAAA